MSSKQESAGAGKGRCSSRQQEPGCRRGFTLIELLVVALILGVVITAITSCLIGGIRAWEYVSKYGTVEVDALVKLETIQRETANTFRFYMISLSGGASELSFPGLVEESPGNNAEPRIGTIKYYFDQQKKELLRKSWMYPATEPANEQPEKILSGLNGFKVSYYSLPSTNDSSGGVWQEAWTSVSNLPGAVTMEMSFEGDNKKPVVIKRTIMIPAAAAPASGQDQKAQAKRPGAQS